MSSINKILIVRLSAIGDVVHSLPVLYALRKRYPNAFIGWVVEDKAADLVLGNPLIDKVYVLPKNKWKKQGLNLGTVKEFCSFLCEVRKEKFDVAIDLQELFKSAIITFLSGAKRRIAHAKTREFAHLFVNEKLHPYPLLDPDRMVISRNMDAAVYLGASADEIKFPLPPVNSSIKNKINSLTKDLNPNKPIIVFCPATIWPSKHWIDEYWSILLDNLALKANIIFTGAVTDVGLIDKIVSGANNNQHLSLVGKLGLMELVELFNRADIVIAPDTGPAHIAAATEKPFVIGIYGSTSYKRTTVYGEKHILLYSQINCYPCHKKTCPQKKNNNMECMKKITPEKILEVIEKKLLN